MVLRFCTASIRPASRPHQGRDNEVLICEPPPKHPESNCDVLKLSDIRCNSRLGGLLKSYSRKAA